MAKKKSRKKSGKKKPAAKVLRLSKILKDLSDAERELKKIRKRLVELRPICRRPPVVKS